MTTDNADTAMLEVREALVIHRGDVLIIRIEHNVTADQAMNLKTNIMKRLGGLVADVLVIAADGLYVVRP